MPNHFHIVIRPAQGSDLSKWMQWLMTSHVRRYHSHYKTFGHIWQGRFKSFIIQEDNHLLAVLRYVEANPTRALLVNSAADWPWSSLRERLSKTPQLIIETCPIELPEKWKEFVDLYQSREELTLLRRSVNRQTPFGDEHWQVKVSKQLGLLSTLHPRGRPKKI